MEFYSHPDKTVFRHFDEVNDNMTRMLKGEYSDECNILSYCHDFGKYTSYFQKYLFSKDKKEDKLANHGFVSALFASYIALCEFGEDSVLPLVSYGAVLHHHGSVKNLSIDLPRSFKGIRDDDSTFLLDKIDIAKIQLEDIKKNKDKIESEYKKIGFDKYFREFIEDIPVGDVLCKLKKIEARNQRKEGNADTYFIFQLLYSALISSDKISASNTSLYDDRYVAFEKLNEFRKEKFKDNSGKLNNMRKEIFDEIQLNIEKHWNENKIFSITSPTGTGKTYAGFLAAVKMRELLGGNRRIVYSLPFTSIINQNYEDIRELFNNVKDFKENEGHYILKHHSLTNVDFQSEFEDYDILQSELLTENWSSAVVVTTFVQLLETLVGNRNRMLKKFNSMKGSIILLDEVQAIDVKYLKLVDYILRAATKHLDCRIIMMTATRPIILQDSTELLSSYQNYFKEFDRTKLVFNLNPVTIDEFADDFIINLEDKSYLVICNTIKQSLKLFKKLKGTGRKVLYLSTNLIPKHRWERIDEIKSRLENKEKIVVISTQVVEAGVNFDFDEVIRDIAPLDSIIQAAGRCNRNDKKGCSIVRVVCMVDDRGRAFGKYVYGNTSIKIVAELLSMKEEVSEREYLPLINEYFTSMSANVNDDVSKKLIYSIEKLMYSKGDSYSDGYALGDFSLIEQDKNYIDVYMQVDDEAETIYKKMLEALGEKDINIKKEKLLKIRSEIREYTISIPVRFKNRINDIEEQLVINLPREGCEEYYNPTTGFNRNEDEEEYMFF